MREDNATEGKTYVYTYDNFGNITQKKVYPYTTGSLGTATSTVNYTYGTDSDAGWKNLLTKYGNETIDYDAIGNPVKYRGATLTWYGRELKKFVKSGTTVNYTYDADGLRSSKTVNGAKTTYQYLDGQLLYEDRAGTDIYYYYDSYGTPTAITYVKADGTSYTFYIGTNSLGDVNAIYNSAGGLAIKYDYDAWGRIVAETNATGGAITGLAAEWNEINPFRYRGYYYDKEIGLYYLQSRYYDAQTGRFINSDDEAVVSSSNDSLVDKNPYSYCDNNPVIRADEGGALWHIVVGAAIGGVTEIVSQLASNGFDSKKLNWLKIGVSAAAGGASAVVGMWGSAVISSGVSIANDLIDGKRDLKEIASSAVSAGVTSLVVGTVADNTVQKIEFKAAAKLPKRQLKAKVRRTQPEIKGSEINKYKNLSLIKQKCPNAIQNKTVRTIANSIGQVVESFVSSIFNSKLFSAFRRN